MKNKFEPLFNQILVRPIVEETTVLTDKRTLCEYGEVLAIGEDCKRVKVGDMVAFTIWGLNSVHIDDEQHYLVQENPDFLLGKVTNAELEKESVQE